MKRTAANESWVSYDSYVELLAAYRQEKARADAFAEALNKLTRPSEQRPAAVPRPLRRVSQSE
jgi:hypothetical protein